MPFKNRIRLPFQLSRPQYNETRNVYRRADGVTKVQSVVIRKILEGETDWWPELWHENFKIALASDITTVEGERYLGDISQEGDYQIDWQQKFDYPTAKANFKAEVTPFDATNSNCQTCEEATQVSLVDDTYPSDLNQGSTNNSINVILNDNICCYPVTFSIVYYNDDVVSAASISSLGVVLISLKTPIASYNNLKLATYRATCANGGYDEADIYADIIGTEVVCLAPLNLEATEITSSGIVFTWDAPSPAPAQGYRYQLFTVDNPGTPVYEDIVGGPPLSFLTLLEPGTEYIFYIAGQCAEFEISNYIEYPFETLPLESGSCGKYAATYVDPTQPLLNSTITFYTCAGDLTAEPMINGVQRLVCMLESSPGIPVELIITNPYGTGSTDYFYVEPC